MNKMTDPIFEGNQIYSLHRCTQGLEGYLLVVFWEKIVNESQLQEHHSPYFGKKSLSTTSVF
jgi:hypothetical protein